MTKDARRKIAETPTPMEVKQEEEKGTINNSQKNQNRGLSRQEKTRQEDPLEVWHQKSAVAVIPRVNNDDDDDNDKNKKREGELE